MTEYVRPVFPTQSLDDLSTEEQNREVYARFGLAMFYVQGLEATLVNLLLVASVVVGTKDRA